MIKSKIRHHVFLVLSVFLVILNCNPRFDTNVRISVKGTVLDTQGNPIEGAEVSTSTRRRTGIFLASGPSGSNEFILGKNYSDANGDFSVVSLYDGKGDFSIAVSSGDDYSEYVYVPVFRDAMLVDNIFNLEDVVLSDLAVVNYNITRSSSIGNSINFTFRFIYPFCTEVYLDGVLNEDESLCNVQFYISQGLNDNISDSDGTLSTVIGSTLEFVYSINNAPEITETFIIDESDFQFNFIY